MKRRRDDPPPDLLIFRGRMYKTRADYEAAYDAWYERRRRWLELVGADEADDLPMTIDGECPYEDEFPHGGMWSRPNGEDVVRCREHGLAPGEH